MPTTPTTPVQLRRTCRHYVPNSCTTPENATETQSRPVVEAASHHPEYRSPPLPLQYSGPLDSSAWMDFCA